MPQKNCTVTRIGRLCDAILVTDDGFGALMCQKCAQSQAGGGGDTIGGGGGSANREPGSFLHVCIYTHILVYVYIYTDTHNLYFIQ